MMEKLSTADDVLGYEHDVAAATVEGRCDGDPKLGIEQQPRQGRTEELPADGWVKQHPMERRHHQLSR
jgi:hypothetical protein